MKLRLFGFVIVFLLAFFAQANILLSPSHPFVDDNNNGIDDFEEGAGQYVDPEVRAKIYGVNFPIADLGNCQNYNECRNFCEDPVNSESCIDYGKQRGFYQDDPVVVERERILQEARTRLGCDSYEACLNFCEIPANFDNCNSFARSQGIVGGVIDDPGSSQIIDKAKEVLGCDSANSCQSFCLQQDNIDKCKSFAEEVGLRGGERQVGPGGCASEGTCRSFCSDPNNFQVCSGFQEVSGGTFTGPGGCSDPASCFSYCQQNPADCGYQGELGEGGVIPQRYDPTDMCNRTPNCSWTGSSCQCGYYGETKETAQKAQEYAGFCASNPDKCRPGQPGMFGSSEQRSEFEDFCASSPDKCRPPAEQASPESYGRYGGNYYGGRAPDPAADCGRYGCSWTGSSCECTSATVRAYTPPVYMPSPEGSAPPYGAPGGGSSGGYSGDPGGGTTTYTPQSGYTPPPGYTPPSGGGTYTPPSGYTPSSGSYSGSGSYTPPSTGSYTPPSTGSYTPPSTESYTPPSQPSEPSQPSQPSQPSEPSQPSQPSQPSEPSQPSQPSGGDSGGGGGGSYTPPSGMTYGAYTARGLLQLLLDFLQGK